MFEIISPSAICPHSASDCSPLAAINNGMSGLAPGIRAGLVRGEDTSGIIDDGGEAAGRVATVRGRVTAGRDIFRSNTISIGGDSS